MKKLIPLLMSGLLLAGCVFNTTPAESIPTKPDEIIAEPQTTPVTTPETTSPVTVTIYYGNENADGFETAQVQVDEMNMNVLVEQLIIHGVLPENVHIGSMQIDGTCLRLNFSPAFADYVNTLGSSGEKILFGSVVNTFLTAWPEAETVFITANGEIIESGHVVYDFEMGFFN